MAEETSYYETIHRLDIDSQRLIIFTLKSSKKKTWYARIRRKNGSGYFQRSLKTTNEAEARIAARKLYLDMYSIEERGLKYIGSKFSDAFREFINSGTMPPGRIDRAVSVFTRYFSPYFRNIEIHLIDTASFKRYLEWRVDFWARKTDEEIAEMRARGDRVYNTAKKPRETTLKSERQLMKQFLYWAEEKGFIEHVPSLKVSFKTLLGSKTQETRLRSKAVSRKQARRIERLLRKYCLTDGAKDPNPLRRFSKARLYFFIYWSKHTLIRPSTELSALKWGDVDLRDSQKEDGQKLALINVTESKTGKPRVCVMPYGQVRLITRWHKICREADGLHRHGFGRPHDYVFPAWDGSRLQPTKLGRLLSQKLRLWGEHLNDETSKVITLYSLARHTGITNRIENGWSVGQVATAAGTSIKQISSFYYEAFVKADPDKWANTFSSQPVRIGRDNLNEIKSGVAEMEEFFSLADIEDEDDRV
jgi:hypothetical protein